jgi:hypothetical protein
MIELGKKTIINKDSGYHWTLLHILEFLEDSHINVLYAYNSLNRTPLSYVAKCKTISFDLNDYKEKISENKFRIDYIFIESDSGIHIIDKWLNELDINIVYITNKVSLRYLVDRIDFNNQYTLSTKNNIQLYGPIFSPDKLQNYIIKDNLLNIEYNLRDLKISINRDKKIRDLVID